MGTKSRIRQPEQEFIEFKAIMRALKRILRERKITYADLAHRLGLSESGVKKILSSRDCSFARLSQIARILGFSVADILDEIESTELKSAQFSLEQQQYLLKNKRTFQLFVKLVFERDEVLVAQQVLRMGDHELGKCLRGLDRFNLIQLLPGNRIKLPRMIPIKDFGGGPLLSAIYLEWSSQMVQDLANPKYLSTGQFIIRNFKMRNETYQELLSRLVELEKEFMRRAVREMNVAGVRLNPVRWVWLTDQKSFIKGAN